MTRTSQAVSNAPPALFDAVLYPNRSLSRQGFALLMTAIVAISALLGGIFLYAGAWPVTGLFGLDVLLVWAAFRWNYRAGRLTEMIRLDREGLHVRRIAPNGRAQDWHFEPYWVRVDVPAADDHDGVLRVGSRGKSVVLGAFLAPEERASLGRHLRQAVAELRAGPGPG
jgi:uncharacterized membrane protein